MEGLPGLWDFLGGGDHLQQEGLWAVGGSMEEVPGLGLQVIFDLLMRELTCQLGQSFCYDVMP